MPEPSFQDETLWARAARGDREALDTLVALALPKVRKFLFRLAGFDATHVDDQAQEVFMRLLDGMSRLRAPGAGPSWMFRTALHVHREGRRRRDRDAALEPLDESSTAERLPAGPLARTLDRERAAWVRTAIAGLPTTLREVLVLSTYERLAPREIATVLDLTREAVRHRLHRARNAVREQLARFEEVVE